MPKLLTFANIFLFSMIFTSAQAAGVDDENAAEKEKDAYVSEILEAAGKDPRDMTEREIDDVVSDWAEKNTDVGETQPIVNDVDAGKKTVENILEGVIRSIGGATGVTNKGVDVPAHVHPGGGIRG